MSHLAVALDSKPHDESAPPAVPPKYGVRERWRKPACIAASVGMGAALLYVPAIPSKAMRAFDFFGGLTFVLIAIVGRLWCACYIAGRKNAELCTAGPYSVVRHPLYVFSSVGVFGVLLATDRPVLAGIGFGVFWLYHRIVTREEDARLAQVFGIEFLQYRQMVPAWVPNIRRFRDVDTLVVSMRPLRRAFIEVPWFFAAWLIAHATGL